MLVAGTTLGSYEVLSLLGKGGMGEVYRARDRKLKRDVAIKVLPLEFSTDPERLARFQREAEALAALNHPNIAGIHEIGDHTDSTRFLVLELVEGETLAERLARGPMSVDEAFRAATHICDALDAVHQKGFVHRDLKPANIKITPAGRVKVLDFGLAKMSQRGQTPDELSELATIAATTRAQGIVVGTIAYMAPEQMQGEEITPASDLYALGLILYEMVTGTMPFSGESLFSAALKRMTQPPPSPRMRMPDLDARWEATILRCLERDPANRFARAADVAEALRTGTVVATAAASVMAPPVTGVTSPVPVPQRSPVMRVIGIAAAVTLAMALTGFVAWTSSRTTADPTADGAAAAGTQARRAVAVLGFKNLSGREENGWLSAALAEMLTTEVAAGETVRAIPGENVARMKMELRLADSDSFARDTLTRIRTNLRADLVVLGSYLAVGPAGGGKIRLDVRVQDAEAGETVAAFSETGTEAEVLDLVSRAGASLRGRLGIAMSPDTATMVRASMPATTESARLYIEGLSKLRLFDAAAARERLELAVAADPKHALSHSALAAAWSQLGYDGRAQEAGKRSFELAESLPRQERLEVEARYRETMREWDKAIDIYRTLFGFFPDNLDYGLRLAQAQVSGGKGKDALATTASLRTLAAAREDPRIDFIEAGASSSLGDFRRSHDASAQAARAGQAQGATLVAAAAMQRDGIALRNLGQIEQAGAAFTQAQQFFERAGDRRGVANALLNAGTVLYDQGNQAGAVNRFREALGFYRSVDDKLGQSRTLNNLGGMEFSQGRLAAAERLFSESLAIAREIDNKRTIAVTLSNIGVIQGRRGEVAQARTRGEEALSVFRAIGDRSGEAEAVHSLAYLLEVEGDLAGARKMYEEALAIRRAIGADPAAAVTLQALGGVLLHQGDPAAARARCQEAVDITRKTGASSDAELCLAEVLIAEARGAEAEPLARAAAAAAGQPDAEVPARVLLARALRARGDAVGARTEIERASARAASVEDVSLLLSVRLERAAIESMTDPTLGRTQLAAVQKDARARGFVLLSRRAAAALDRRAAY